MQAATAFNRQGGSDLPRTTLFVLTGILTLRILLAGLAPITDPTEGRYAEIARGMAVSGDWVTPRVSIDGEQVPYLGKPPLFFWTAALSIGLLGPSELAARLPALIASVILLAFMYYVLRRTKGVEIAAMAVVITATTGLVFVLSASVIVDVHLTLFVAGAVFAHCGFVEAENDRSRRRWSLLFFALLAGGVLTKGPVAIVLVVVPVVVWNAISGSWATLRAHSWSAGFVVFALIAGPWFILAESRNPGFLEYFFVNENLLRFLSAGYGDRYGTGHIFPRGSAVVMFVLGALPWTPVAIRLLARRRFEIVRSVLRDPRPSLFLIGFVWVVVFWSFARQLLPTYVLPAVPLFAAWLACEMRRVGWPLRFIRDAAVGITAVWFLMILAVMPLVATRSTRGVLAETVEVLDTRIGPTKVVFAGRTPQSAIFYAPDLVTPHRVETVDRSLAEFTRTGSDSVLIIRDRDWQALSREHRSSVSSIAEVPGWRVLSSRAVGRETASRAGFPGSTSQMAE